MGLVHGNFQTSSNIAARCDIHVAGPFPLNSRSAERARSVPGLSLDISGSALLDYQHLLYVVLATAMYGLHRAALGCSGWPFWGFSCGVRCAPAGRRRRQCLALVLLICPLHVLPATSKPLGLLGSA